MVVDRDDNIHFFWSQYVSASQQVLKYRKYDNEYGFGEIRTLQSHGVNRYINTRWSTYNNPMIGNSNKIDYFWLFDSGAPFDIHYDYIDLNDGMPERYDITPLTMNEDDAAVEIDLTQYELDEDESTVGSGVLGTFIENVVTIAQGGESNYAWCFSNDGDYIYTITFAAAPYDLSKWDASTGALQAGYPRATNIDNIWDMADPGYGYLYGIPYTGSTSLYRFDEVTGQATATSFSVPTAGGGVAWDGAYLWVGDMNIGGNTYYRLRVEPDGDVTHLGTYNLIDHGSSTAYAMAVVGSSLFVASGTSDQFFYWHGLDREATTQDLYGNPQTTSQSGSSMSAIVWDGEFMYRKPANTGPIRKYEMGRVYNASSEYLEWSVTDFNRSLVKAEILPGLNTREDRITITPVVNVSGSDIVELAVTDSYGVSTTMDMPFTINPVNDQPWISPAIMKQNKQEDAPPWTVDLTAYEGDIEDRGSSISNILGNDGHNYNEAGRGRGNKITATLNAVITEIQQHINLQAYQDIYFAVYRMAGPDSSSGTQVFSMMIKDAMPGKRWISSGPINVPIKNSETYAIMTYWEGQAYWYDFNGGMGAYSPWWGTHVHNAYHNTFPPNQTPASLSHNDNWVPYQNITVAPASSASLTWSVSDVFTTQHTVINIDAAKDWIQYTPKPNMATNDNLRYWLMDSGGMQTTQWAWTNYSAVNDYPSAPAFSTWSVTGNDLRLIDHTPRATWGAANDVDSDPITYYVYSQSGRTGQWALEGTTNNLWYDLSAWNWRDGDWGRWYVFSYDGALFSKYAYAASVDDTGVVDMLTNTHVGGWNDPVSMGNLIPGSTQVRGLLVGDIDGNGYDDILLSNGTGSSDFIAYFQNTSGHFEGPVEVGERLVSGYLFGAALGDYDNDGDLDMISNMNQQTIMRVYENNGNGWFSHSSTITMPAAYYPRGGSSGDVNNDGNTDYMVTTTGDDIYLWLGNGDLSFQAPTSPITLAGSSNKYGIDLGDINSNGNLDCLFTNASTGEIWKAMGNGDGTFQSPVFLFDNGGTTTIPCLVDYDADSDLDLLVHEGAASSSFYSYPGFNDGTFGAASYEGEESGSTVFGLDTGEQITQYFQFNTAPPIPPSTTDLLDHLIDHTPTVTWGAATDADGDPVTYRIESSDNGQDWTVEITGFGGLTRDLIRYYWADGENGYWRVRSYDGYEYSGGQFGDTTEILFTECVGNDTNNRYTAYGDDKYLNESDPLIVDSQTAADTISFSNGAGGEFFTFRIDGHLGETLNMTFFTQLYYTQPSRMKALTLYGGSAIDTFDRVISNELYQINNTGTYIEIENIPIIQDPYYLKLQVTGGETSNTFAIDWYRLYFSNASDTFTFNSLPSLPSSPLNLSTRLVNHTIEATWGISTDPDGDPVQYHVMSQKGVSSLVNADEVFLTNSVSGIAPVTEIDMWKIGAGKPGPYGLKFQEIYLNWLKTGVNGTQCFPEAWEG
jgi:hypothetical protein